MQRAILGLVAWLCLFCAAAAQAPTLTFPALTGRVVDSAHLLAPQDQAALTASLAGLQARTADQLVVVTLPSLQGRPIEEFGYQLGRFWGIGQKGKDSGALLIVAAGEKQVRIEVGYGLEGTLTDAATKIIIETSILPAFRAGDFAGGIKAGTARIVSLLDGDSAAAAPAQPPTVAVHGPPQPVWPLVALGLLAAIVLIFCAIHGGFLCQAIFQILFMFMSSGRGNSSGGPPRFSGGGGSFGGGGSSGSW